MSKSRPFFLSNSSLRMIGTRNDPFDGGARPPAPDLVLCAQDLPLRRAPAETATPAAKPCRTDRRDVLPDFFMLPLVTARMIKASQASIWRQLIAVDAQFDD